jgi:uncharacterized repeat protein (TIGR02543 family)
LDNTGSLVKTGNVFMGWNTVADGSGTPYVQGDSFFITVNTTLYAQWAPATFIDASVIASSPAFTPVLTGSELGGVPGCSMLAASHPYTTITFNALASVIHSATTTALTGMGGDNFLAFYDGVFDPQNPTVGLLGCNDDMGGMNRTWAQFTTDTALTSGHAYTAVFTSWGGGAGGIGDGTFGISPAVALAYSVGGTLSGVTGGSLVLQVNGGNDLTLSSNGSFSFGTALADTAAYAVTVLTQPAGQTCTVTGDSGAISSANVTDITVACVAGVSYSVTYNGNSNTGGTVPTDATAYSSGATVTVAANSGNLVRTGYTFGGWNTQTNGLGTNYTAGSGTFAINANTTLYAKWNAVTYTATYNGNTSTGGSVPTDSSSPYTSGNTVTVLGNTNGLVKTGSTFNGWNTAANGSGTPYAPAATFAIASNTTLYAQWTLISTFGVTYSGNTSTGGSVPTDSSSPYTSGNTVTVLGNTNGLVKAGYTFNGWNTAANGSGTAQAAASTFTMGGAAVTLYAQWTTAAVNGACATIVATAFVPTTGLCTQGTAPSSATTGSPWTWSCTGSGGGTTASCSAPNASTATGSGTGRASISGGSWVVEAANSGFVASSTVPSLPPGTTLPHGLLNLKLTAGVAGSTATVLITYPSALPAGTVYWKYGKTASNTTAHWYQFAGAVVSGNTVTLTLTDGADGDDDYTANGTITDPGGPGVSATTTVEPLMPEVPVVPLIPPLASLPTFPGIGSNGLTVLNLGEGAGPSMTGCLRTTLNDLLGPDWLHRGQSADGGARLSRTTEIISFYPIEANTNTTYGLGQGFGIYLRNANALSVVTACGTFLTLPALYNPAEFGALLNAAGQTAHINAQGIVTFPVGGFTYAVRPGYWVTQGTPGAPGLSTGADGQLRFTDSAGQSQILNPAFIDPQLLNSQVSQAVGGWTVIQTDGTALVTLLNGQKFVLTPDLALGTVPAGTMTIWWQDGPNHYRIRNSDFSNTSQGFSVSPR